MHVHEQVLSWSKSLLPCILPVTECTRNTQKTMKDPERSTHTIVHFVRMSATTPCVKQKQMVNLLFFHEGAT